jgi:prepilin signal peptidase PulO-like enzyme (type II secretory pathway)
MTSILLLIIGIIFGSFVNAFVWRLHEQLDDNGEPKKLTKKQQKQVSIIKGRSMCPQCKHTLAAKDLIPIISWLSLSGKCRYCKKPISKQYPLIELLTGALFSISYTFWPYDFSEVWHYIAFINWLLMVTGFVALSLYDIKWMLLPNRIVFPLMWIATGALALQFMLGRPLNDFAGICSAVVVAGGIFWVLYQISKGTWIGGGDVKLGLLIGLLLTSAAQGVLFLFVASLLGLLYSLPLMLTNKLKTSSKVPFGPFLMASAFIVVLWGQSLINWYTNSLLGL